MARKAAVKKVARPLPQSIEEVDAHVARIGEIQRDKALNELAMNEELEAVRAKWAAINEPLGNELNELIEDVISYAGVNRDSLTDNGKTKTVKLRSGELRWRFTPQSVTVTGVETVKKSLEDLGLQRFLRPKTEIDKEAMLKEPAVAMAVNGISIGRREEFVIVPNESQIEVVKPGKKIALAIDTSN